MCYEPKTVNIFTAPYEPQAVVNAMLVLDNCQRCYYDCVTHTKKHSIMWHEKVISSTLKHKGGADVYMLNIMAPKHMDLG